MTVRVQPEAIHEALLDDEALLALPTGLARAAGARWAMIQWRHVDGVHEIMASSRHAPAWDALYAWKYAPIDPWVKAALASLRRGEWLFMDEHVPLRVFRKSRYQREFIRGQGDDTTHAAVVVFDSAWGDGVLCLYRGKDEPPFAPSDLAPLDERLLHLGCVLRARGESIARRRREQVARDSLDAVELGAIVVQDDGRVLRVNIAADRLLRRSDGFQTGRGLLSCVDPASRMRLQGALALATAPDNPMATVISVERGCGAPGLAGSGQDTTAHMVSVTPMRGERGEALAMLVFRDPGCREETLLGRLRAFFGAGRAERDGPACSRAALGARTVPAL
jgi:hypothetical protein